jgi:hypothetical protein
VDFHRLERGEGGLGWLGYWGRKERRPKALMAERSSGNMPGNAAFFRYQRAARRWAWVLPLSVVVAGPRDLPHNPQGLMPKEERRPIQQLINAKNK